MGTKKKNSSNKNIALAGLFIILCAISLSGYYFYQKIYLPNVELSSQNELFIYIPTGSTFEDVKEVLTKENILTNPDSFEWVARQMDYPSKVKAGKYLLKTKMNNKDLVMLLRSGRQTPVKLVFNNIRTIEQLASVISKQIEADSASISDLLHDNAYLEKSGFNSLTCLSVFLPNTYEFFWNTSAKGFYERMLTEHKKFWNEGRIEKAVKSGLNQIEVATLASIVENETNKNDEKPIIAGVYLNRLRKNWKLEADPTLVFASGDFTIKRVLNIHKEIDSPYNTYKNMGLPPGPICIPSIASIDAVLNYAKHNYMFFCAKDDFSGYHSFASTYNQHLINARRFQQELNRRKIRS